MQVSFFENAYFLRAVGWAIANNLWQAGFLWLMYKALAPKRSTLPALVKYYFSLAFLSLSFTWFVFTVAQNYQLQIRTGGLFTMSAPGKLEQVAVAFPFFAVAYLGMLLYYLVKFFHHYLRVRFVSTNGLVKAPLQVRLFTNNTAIHLGIKKTIQVWISAHVDVPSVTGFLKPMILLPAAILNNLSTEQVNAVLLHELAHVKRNDFLVNFLQSVVTLILFFNPFVILLNRAVKKERENCCDDQVLNYQFDRLGYAKALLLLEEQRHEQVTLALAATDSKKLLSMRIKRLFAIQNPVTTTSAFQKLQLSGFSLLLFIGICLLVPPLNQPGKKPAIRGIDNTWIIPAKIFSENEVALPEHPLPIVNDQKMVAISFGRKVVPGVTKKSSTPRTTQKSAPDNGFTIAMVNDQLFKNKREEAVASAIANKVKDTIQSVLVKIEEQQSGKTQTNTYYFKINERRGIADIQPLLILKKYASVAPIYAKKKPGYGKQKMPAVKFTGVKRRITT